MQKSLSLTFGKIGNFFFQVNVFCFCPNCHTPKNIFYSLRSKSEKKKFLSFKIDYSFSGFVPDLELQEQEVLRFS